MNSVKKKLSMGAILAILGAAGIILGPHLGFTELGRAWSFIAGFIFGLLSGAGVALSVFGILEKRKKTWRMECL